MPSIAFASQGGRCDCRLLCIILSMANRSPLEHAYTLYDIAYRPERTLVLAEASGDGGVAGYLLVYRAAEGTGYLYLWRGSPRLLAAGCRWVRGFGRIVLQLSERLEPTGFTEVLEGCGFRCRVEKYVDMLY